MSAATILAAAVIAYILLRVAAWIGGRRAVWTVGVLLVAPIVYQMVDITYRCSYKQPPVITGTAIFADCGGLEGTLSLGFAWLVCPAIAVAMLALTLSVARRALRTTTEA